MKEKSKPLPPPEKPDPNECCGSGCVPCIYDYYYDRLAEWEDRYGLSLVEYQTKLAECEAS